MAVNKVVFGTQTLIDLTQDTVTADNLRAGYTAHGADGNMIVGTLTASGSASTPRLVPYMFDDVSEHIVENGVWKSYSSYARIFVFEVTARREYMIILGCPTETFHVMFTTTDVTQTDEEVTGAAITDEDDPIYFSTVRYRPDADGYLVIETGRYGEYSSNVYVYDAQKSWGGEAE